MYFPYHFTNLSRLVCTAVFHQNDGTRNTVTCNRKIKEKEKEEKEKDENKKEKGDKKE